MANSDKNIVISPNIGSSVDNPKIVFSAANASTGPQNITLTAYPINSGTLSWEGSAGQLFSISNNLTSGPIFSVNNISGIPLLEVDASGTISLSPVIANVGIGTTNPTSKLTVAGNTNISGIITASSFSGSASGLTNIPAGQLTGVLPAIDGSNLFNLVATGTGIVIEDNQVNVGSATTIDFGTGLDVTFSAGIATITASGGSLQSRTIVSGATTSIINNAIGNIDITGFKSYALMKVGLSTAGWLRIYTDSASRDADVSRSVGEDPVIGSGVIAEVVTTGISTTQIISPFVMGGNLDNPADTTIYASIKNLSGSTQAITANLTILQLEA